MRHGWHWIVHGWRLFTRKPLTWIVYTFVTWVIVGASALHPLLVALVAVMLPVLIAGWTLACQAADAGRPIPVTMLFQGFRGRIGDLASIGGLNLMGNVVLMLVLLAFGGDTFIAAVNDPSSVSADDLRALQGRMSLALILIVAIGLPLAMAVWFAPVAVALDGMRGPAALMASMRAILRNPLPFLLYSFVLAAIGLGLFGVASAIGLDRPAATEVAFWVLLPLVVTSVYSSYRDLFPAGTSPPKEEEQVRV